MRRVIVEDGMAISNRELVQKADLAVDDLVNDGGYLLPAQFKNFLRTQIKRAKLSGMITRVTLRSHQQKMPRLRFNDQVLHPKVDGESLTIAQRSKPNLGRETFNAKEFGCEVRLTRGDLEDNVEGKGLEQTITDQLYPAVGRDMEKVAIRGDTASADPFLAQFDGIIKQASSHVVDAAGARLTRTYLESAALELPEEYEDEGDDGFLFMTSKKAQRNYMDSLASRATQLGDDNITNAKTPDYRGEPVEKFSLWPSAEGGTSNRTRVIYAHPKNIFMGTWRKILVERDRDISAGVLLIVITLRFDTRFGNEDSVVKINDVLN